MEGLDSGTQRELQAALRNPKSRLGRYVLLGSLGQGGMGLVFKGYDPDRQQLVAIKQVLDASRTPERCARFEREGQLASRLAHPHIGRVVEAVTEGRSAPYLVLEYVPGQSLDQVYAEAPLSSGRAAQIMLEVSQAIAYAHAQGVVHRDLKPQNIQITPAGQAVVLDFGLAKSLDDHTQSLTRSGQMLGTLAYMSPEQATGARHAGPQADVYGLGAILYECLTGRGPFDADTIVTLLNSIQHDPPRPPRTLKADVHPTLERLCLECLAKAPEERPDGAQAVADALERFLGGDVRDAEAPRPARLLGALALVALALGIVLAVLLTQRGGTTEPAPRVTQPEPTASREAARLRLRQAILAALEFREDDLQQPDIVETTAPFTAAGTAPGERSLALAARALWTGRPRSEAYAHLDAALGRDPRLFLALALRGLLRVQDKNHKGASADFHAAIRLEPELRILYARRGQARLNTGDVGGALADLDRAVREKPEPYALVYRGVARFLRRDLQGAMADYEQALDVDPQFGRAFASRAFIHTQRRDLPAAIADYGRALTHQARGKVRAKWLARRGGLKAEQGDLQGALADVVQALHIDDGDAFAYQVRGYVRRKRGQLDQALADYDRSLKLFPKDATALRGRALCRADKRQYDLALIDANQAIRLQPRVGEAYSERARYKINTNDIAGAEADLRAAMRFSPKLGQAYVLRGVIREDRGQLQDALQDYTMAITLDPKDADAYGARALVWGKLNQVRKKLLDQNKAVALKPDAFNHYNRGYTRSEMGWVEGAIEDFTAALKHNPKWAVVYAIRGSLLRDQQQKYAAALADYDKAIEFEPKRAQSYYGRGLTQQRLGKLREAALDYERCLKRKPDHEESEMMREFIRTTLGRRSKH